MSGGRADGRTGGLCLIVAALSAGPTVRPSVQDPGPILDRASAAYATVRTLSADFVQVVVNPLVGGPDTTRGRLYQMRPNHFAMRFSDPRGDRIVADGRYFWVYTPSTTPGQVIRAGIPDAGPTGPNLIGQFVEAPRERYRARYLRADSLATGWADVVALARRADDGSPPWTEAVIWVDRHDGLLRRIEIVETSGQRRFIALRNLKVNAGVPTGEITFSPPAGVRVVDQ
ncbi:MAG: LolA family protein [Gemmatimonadales bacterium]